MCGFEWHPIYFVAWDRAPSSPEVMHVQFCHCFPQAPVCFFFKNGSHCQGLCYCEGSRHYSIYKWCIWSTPKGEISLNFYRLCCHCQAQGLHWHKWSLVPLLHSMHDYEWTLKGFWSTMIMLKPHNIFIRMLANYLSYSMECR